MITRLAIGCLAALLAWPASAQVKDETFSIGVVISISQAPYYLALERGYFAAEHVKPEPGVFRGAQETVAALATGQLDVSMGAISAGFFNAAHQGLDLRVVASAGVQPGPVIATPPIVRTDLWDSGAIRSGKDLRGRKVAVNVPGSIPEFLLTTILERYGMTLADVDETTVGFPEQVIALKNQAIDVGFLPEPFATRAQHQGLGKLLEPEAGVGTGEITTMVFFSGRMLRERPEVGSRVLRALVRAARDLQGPYNKDPAIAQILAKSAGLTVEDVTGGIPFAFDRDLDIEKYLDSLRRQERANRINHRLTYSEPLAFEGVVDASLVHKAAESLK